ncbi:pyridoxamine 5'-phosphate oxidase family protein [Methylopila turkensis]|uniref:Pyridoxamine 5'-phosphate oxidase n=1 Tax=Methylopila turkensis TaxID=1437816 RepID=A0A9W6N5X9_9HYPH|nr:pyridoxamine 5'-phosphate oxidase family protein [Methylopila turkensis]GLK79644.1 pyridoxamine 5'-phosphate oxidase [Methylopila turkensis]
MSANIVATIEQLEAIYGAPAEPSLVKQVARLTPEYRAIIEASPFAALATSGPEGLDCSPRGDGRGFVRIADDRTLILPDRKGNNRIDSLRNVLRDPRVALLFLVPGAGVTLRVNGRAEISVDPDLLASFAVDGAAPRTALVIAVEAVYFQCARAVIRSKLWDPAGFVAPGDIPTPGRILAAITDVRIDGEAYDRAWPAKAATTLW